MGVLKYIQETRGELKHVSWPTRKQAVVYTVIVVVISLAIAAYLGFFDWVFTSIIQIFL